MKCPHCPDTALVMSDRQGVEIDYCPSCRGIWLDRGELDKLLDRSAAAAAQVPAAAPSSQRHRQPDFEDSDYHRTKHSPYGRKKSWLHEIFD